MSSIQVSDRWAAGDDMIVISARNAPVAYKRMVIYVKAFYSCSTAIHCIEHLQQLNLMCRHLPAVSRARIEQEY